LIPLFLDARMNGANFEKKALKLGYLYLSDYLPLLVTKETGGFEREGLKVELLQEVSWMNIRDKVIEG